MKGIPIAILAMMVSGCATTRKAEQKPAVPLPPTPGAAAMRDARLKSTEHRRQLTPAQAMEMFDAPGSFPPFPTEIEKEISRRQLHIENSYWPGAGGSLTSKEYATYLVWLEKDPDMLSDADNTTRDAVLRKYHHR